MTSVLIEFVQLGSTDWTHPLWPFSAWPTKPSILPALISVVAFVLPCGPPPFLSVASWYGCTHPPLSGSGTHTVNFPFWRGSPSTPGYRPKYSSRLRFSCMITTMCWIFCTPVARLDVVELAVACGDDVPHAPKTRTIARPAARRVTRRG